ncbi:MAG: aminoglycoside phosphotransferase family protein, partial [Geminicoccaceae bacterium]
MDHEAEPSVVEALGRLALLAPGEVPRFTRLTGGVSSDIWRVDLAQGPVCVKRALARLRVAADWRAPIERNAYEAAWMRHAAAIVPQAVPALLGQDARAGVLVMAYLPEG